MKGTDFTLRQSGGTDFTLRRLASLLPFPVDDAHKYSRGRVVLLAGSARYPGAAALAAYAAQRMGAGYTQVYTEEQAVQQIQAFRPSLVVRSWEHLTDEVLASSGTHPLAYVIGCGFDPENDYSGDLTRKILKETDSPVLLDGGALSFLAEDLALREAVKARGLRGAVTVLTPHPGEAKRLPEAEGLSAIVVYKGSDTRICAGERSYTITQGSAALAKAGTGDVLAGMIGALLAQGTPAFEACVLGVYLHAQAGNSAAEALTSICVTPEDVIEHLPRAIKGLHGKGLQGQAVWLGDGETK